MANALLYYLIVINVVTFLLLHFHVLKISLSIGSSKPKCGEQTSQNLLHFLIILKISHKGSKYSFIFRIFANNFAKERITLCPRDTKWY